jgi:tetratricopeptide (TPR) repeat protein
VGLSRDVTALTLTARTLKRSGKTEAALRAYRLALELAADADPSRLAAPAFDDDPQVRRFRLPHEAIVGAVIREIIEAGEWGFSAWSSALPPRAVVRLTAARILREKGDTDAERAFGLVLADDVTAPASAILIAEELAARGEALALTERRREAAERYREAIAIAADDAIRRRWRLALAEVLTPLGESGERAALLEAAKASDPTDDVTRKAIEAQQFAGLK